MLWSLALRQLVTRGFLSVQDAGGRTHYFGNKAEQPAVAIKLHKRWLHTGLFLNPGLYVGEAYMDGTLTIASGTLRDLMTLFCINLASDRPLAMRFFDKVDYLVKFLQQYNPARRARKNVAHHYDLGDELYTKFLDKDMQYSCAYFQDENDTLEEAQLNKKRHIAAKLRLEPGMRVLDIGCGWGGMALYLAREFDVHVTGITLSKEQFYRANVNAADAGLGKQVEFRLQDFRDVSGEYDRIVSVGMFEHVGVDHYGEFFARIKSLLKPDGIALLHAIGRSDGPGVTNEWLRKYIFPGGYSPALSEVIPHLEKENLWAADIEILRMHYALTLAEWHKRFEASRTEIARLYDERFCRMWEFYLLAAEMQFRYLGAMVFQIQITRDVAATPVTRDYMFECERLLGTAQRLPAPKRYALH